MVKEIVQDATYIYRSTSRSQYNELVQKKTRALNRVSEIQEANQKLIEEHKKRMESHRQQQAGMLDRMANIFPPAADKVKEDPKIKSSRSPDEETSKVQHENFTFMRLYSEH